MAHNYSNTASVAQLGVSMDGVTTTLTVSGGTYVGWPASPFWGIVAKGTAQAELVEVTAVVGSALTVVRGQGGTSAASHGAGDTFHHIAPAVVFATSELHVEATTAVHGVSGSVVGTTGSQTIQDKLYRGGHKSNHTDALPAGLTASFEAVADNANARDGFVHNNTAGDVNRRGFLLAQSGTPRIELFNDGTVAITPSGSAVRPALAVNGNAQASGTLTVTGATVLNGTLTENSTSIFNNSVTVNGVVTPKTIDTQIPIVSDTATRLIIRTRAPADAFQALDNNGTLLASLSSGGSFNLLGGMSTLSDIVSSNAVRAYGMTVPMPTTVTSLGSVTTPVNGQSVHLTTDNCWYRREAGVWVNLGRQEVVAGRIPTPTDLHTSLTTGEQTINKLDVAAAPLILGNVYMFTVDLYCNFTADGSWLLRIRKGLAGSGTVIAQTVWRQDANAIVDVGKTWCPSWMGTANEAADLHVSMERIAGTATYNIRGGRKTTFAVDDRGARGWLEVA